MPQQGISLTGFPLMVGVAFSMSFSCCVKPLKTLFLHVSSDIKRRSKKKLNYFRGVL
jgi:hypothetical protein